MSQKKVSYGRDEYDLMCRFVQGSHILVNDTEPREAVVDPT